MPMSLADLERRVMELERRIPRGPMISTQGGATVCRPYQVGLPVELTSTFSTSTGYDWKTLEIDTSLSSGHVKAPTTSLTGQYAYTTDNDANLQIGDRGWLEIDPQGQGWILTTGGGGGSTSHPVIKARVKSTANVNISTDLEDGDTLNGETLAENDVVFLNDQTTPSQNGLYVVPASGAASRYSEADSSAELAGCLVVVQEGTVDADTIWLCTTDEPITVDTTSLTWVQVYPDQLNPRLCEVTAVASGSHTVKEKTLIGGVISDVAGPVFYSNCYATHGTGTTEFPVGTLVTMYRMLRVTGSAFYWITPAGYATVDYPGLVSAEAQEFNGDKTFDDDVIIQGELSLAELTHASVANERVYRDAALTGDIPVYRDNVGDQWQMALPIDNTSTGQICSFDGTEWVATGTPIYQGDLLYYDGSGGWNVLSTAVANSANFLRGDMNAGATVTTLSWQQMGGSVTGARDDPEGALANLLTYLASIGLITDNTTAS